MLSPLRSVVQRSFLLRWGRRLFALAGIDLAYRFAAQAFVSLVPVMVVAAAISPVGKGEHSFRDTLVGVLGLRGAPAEVLHSLFATGGEVRSEVTVVGVVFLVISALSFTRDLQRIYEVGWELPHRGLRGTGWGFLWLLSFWVYLGLLALAKVLLPGNPAGTLLQVVFALAANVGFWLWTSRALLEDRIEWRRLVPGAVVTGVGLVVVAVAFSLFMPTYIASKAKELGAIGAVFAIIIWFLAVGYVVIAGATVGAVLSEEPGPIARYMAGANKQPSRLEESSPPTLTVPEQGAHVAEHPEGPGART
jgi:membrane protein